MAALTKNQIMKILRSKKPNLEQLGVHRIALFGSYLRNLQQRGSDLDFLVTFDNISFDRYMDLKFFLERTFHRKVDLIIEESLKPRMRHVKKEAIYA